MPTYEYLCTECNQHVEKFQKINDEPLLVCPHCNKPKLIQQISAPAFQLKGTGWYETDFKNKKKVATSSESSAATDPHVAPKAAEKTETTASTVENK